MQNLSVASALVIAAIKAGVLSEKKVKKDGSVKARPYSSKCWPRLRRGQESYTRKVVA